MTTEVLLSSASRKKASESRYHFRRGFEAEPGVVDARR